MDQPNALLPHKRMQWLFAVLFALPLAHMFLILCSQATNSAILRPLGTAAAALLMLYFTSHASGRKRHACLLLGLSLVGSSLFSACKIIYDVTVMHPFMRLLWFVVYGLGIAGAILYITPRTWSIARFVNTLRIAFGGISVGFVIYTLLYTLLYYRDSSLQWNDARIINTPTIAIDAMGLYILGLLYVDQRVNKAVVCSIALLLVADGVHLYMMLAGTFPIQGRSSSLFPIYTAQSILLAFAVYQDMYRERSGKQASSRGEWLLWSVVPIICSFIAGITSVIFPTPIHTWVTAGSLTIVVIHACMTGYDYYRALQRQQRLTTQEREARIMMRGFQHELRSHVTALGGLLPIIQAGAPASMMTTMNVMETTLRDMQTTVNHVLLFSSEKSVPTTKVNRISVQPYLEEFRARVGYHHVELHIQPNIEMLCNQVLLELFLRNAIANAIEAGGSDAIAIFAHDGDDGTCIQVRDKGRGFEQHLLDAARQQRYAADDAPRAGWSSKELGRGLGLPFMEYIARFHHGTFSFGNLPEGGGFVMLQLPRG